MPSLVVLGTGANVGKTLFTLGLCRSIARGGSRPAVIKPVCVSSDVKLGLDGHYYTSESEAFSAAGSSLPKHLACPVVLQPQDSRVTFDLFGWSYEFKLFILGRYIGLMSDAELGAHAPAIRRAIMGAFGLTQWRVSPVIIEGSGSPVEGGWMSAAANTFLPLRHQLPIILLTDVQSGAPVLAACSTYSALPLAARRLLQGLVLSRSIGMLSEPDVLARWKSLTRTEVLGSISAYGADHSAAFAAQMKDAAVTDRQHWYDLIATNVERSLCREPCDLLR